MNGPNPDPGGPGGPLRDFAVNPAWYLRDLDPVEGTAVLSPMDEDSYRASIFLDNRLQRAGTRDLQVDLEALMGLAARTALPRRPIHYLFHMGHCGSTLLSRLLGELPGLLALREPPLVMGLSRSLRRLREPGFPIPEDRWEALFELALACLGRTWRPDQTALVKPTSHAGNLIPRLLRFTGRERALLLYVDLETYLATMLRPEVRRETLLFARDFRIDDFRRLVPGAAPSVDDYSPAQLAAMSWLLHARELVTALDDEAVQGRVRALDFDQFLDAPVRHLQDLCGLFGQPQDPEALAAIAARVMGRSAKDPKRDFGAQQRRQALAAARGAHRAEIEAGMAWAARVESAAPTFRGLGDRLS
jgi:hypothetical protein